MKKILVLGGTGMLGGPVAQRLRADGFDVRLLARDPEKAHAAFDDASEGAAGFEIVAGDVSDLGSLERALQGCDGVHISVGGPVDQLSAENVAALAPKLGLARITRTDRLSVDGWLPLDLTRSDIPPLTRIADLSWVDATDLLVLGGESATASLTPHRVSQDASTITPRGESVAWDAVTLTTQLRSQSAVVVGARGQAWRDVGTSWVPFLDKVTAAAYPG